MDERHDLTVHDYVGSGIDEIIMNANSFKLEYEVSRDRGALPLDDDLAIEVDNCDRHRVLKLNDFFDNLRESGGIPVAQSIGGEHGSQVSDIANMRLEPIKDDLLLPTPIHRELCRREDDQQRRNIECELDSKAPQPPLDTREFQSPRPVGIYAARLEALRQQPQVLVKNDPPPPVPPNNRFALFLATID